ncbi:MAG: phosphomannomutase [Psychrobacter sp.]
MPSFAAQQCLFRAYDIRGSRQHFTTAFVQALGNAFAHLYFKSPSTLNQADSNNSLPRQKHSTSDITVVIGYDVRDGSNTIAQTLSSILIQYGIQVIQLGLVTTPMMVFWAKQYQGHGIIVTASHSAKDILGIKWMMNHLSPSSTEIQTLYEQLNINDGQTSDTAPSNDLVPKLSTKQVVAGYTDAIKHVFTQLYPHDIGNDKKRTKGNRSSSPKLDVIVVIDCMHGATSTTAQQLFEYFCQSVIVLNDTPNGSFPNGNPDPTEPNRLQQLQQKVMANQADLGLAFDGDGDRLMVVNEMGSTVRPDHLLYLLAQTALNGVTNESKQPASSQVLFDIKCSHHLPKLLTELGAVPVMSRTGSSLMRRQIHNSEQQIIFAGELSGHFIFNDGRFIAYDDAMYAALRLLHWLADSDLHQGKIALTDITHRLPTLISTADHYLPMPQASLSGCSLVTQLTQLCQDLQQLVDKSNDTSSINASDALYSLHSCQNNDESSPFCTCDCSESDRLLTIKHARHLLPLGTTLSNIDGLRIDFAHGFGVLRQSNTSNNLTARFAGDSIEALQDIQDKFAALCRPFDKKLAEQITAIPAE